MPQHRRATSTVSSPLQSLSSATTQICVNAELAWSESSVSTNVLAAL
jgi:hypothetical protein